MKTSLRSPVVAIAVGGLIATAIGYIYTSRPESADLKITYVSSFYESKFYTLRCNPVGGTLPNQRAACSHIRKWLRQAENLRICEAMPLVPFEAVDIVGSVGERSINIHYNSCPNTGAPWDLIPGK